MYVEIEYRCRECGETFLFTPREQKYWYEKLGFLTDSRPVNCPQCRRKIRKNKKGAERLGELLHKEDDLSAEELEEMSEIYREMGALTKAEIMAKRGKNKRK